MPVLQLCHETSDEINLILVDCVPHAWINAFGNFATESSQDFC